MYTQGKWEAITGWPENTQEKQVSLICWLNKAKVVTNIPQLETTSQEDIANARLIAAAPELLEACKGLIRLMLDQTALALDKNGQIDDMTSALTVLTHQFNSKTTKQTIELIAKIEQGE